MKNDEFQPIKVINVNREGKPIDIGSVSLSYEFTKKIIDILGYPKPIGGNIADRSLPGLRPGE